jgi:DNA-binding CsgD family transcriptional regulator
MNDRQEDLDQLILDIHASPLDPGRWHSVLESICRIHRAEKGQILSTPLAPDSSTWSVSVDVTPEATADYIAEFAAEDIWIREGIRRDISTEGTISLGEALIDRREYLQTRFYNEFLARHDYDRFMNLVLRPPALSGTPPTAMLSLFRGVGKEAFGDREKEILRRLTPHMILAVKTFWRAREISLHNAALSMTLDAVTTPLFIIDRGNRLLFANGTGETTLRNGDVLRVVDERLVPAPDVREQKVCANALRCGLSGLSATIMLTIRSNGKTVILSTAPLSDSRAPLASWSAAAGLVWLVPMSSIAKPIKRIGLLFALTSAEEKLLVRLSSGERLGDVAEGLRISIHTARSQLKAIQRKTGWRTQGEIMRMIQQLGTIEPHANGNI